MIQLMANDRRVAENASARFCIRAPLGAGADPSPLAVLLVGYVPTGMRPPRALQVAIRLAESLRQPLARLREHDRDLEDHARRCTSGIGLQTSEARRRAGRDRIHLYRVAAGSAGELETALRLAEAWGYLDAAARLIVEVAASALVECSPLPRIGRSARAARSAHRSEGSLENAQKPATPSTTPSPSTSPAPAAAAGTRPTPAGAAEARSRGRTIISDEVVSVIARIAAEQVEGVHQIGESSLRGIMSRERTRGIEAEVGMKEAAVDVELVVEYGYPIKDVAEALRSQIIENVEYMTGRKVVEVNVHVLDVYIPKAEKKPKRQLE
jgi:four helix bundle protein